MLSTVSSQRRASLSPFAARALRALVLILLGLTVTIGSAASDAYLHRGTGDEPSSFVRQPTGRALATNVDLRGMDPSSRDAALEQLVDAGYQYVRQEVSWAQSQPALEAFDWTQTEDVIAAITASGLTTVVVLVDTPFWARAPDDVEALDAPPISAELFGGFCAAFRARFPELRHFQIMRNLDDPAYWGGESFSSLTYQQLLQAASGGLDVAATDSLLIAGEVGSNLNLRRSGADIELLEEMARNPGIRAMVDAFAVTVDGGAASPYDRSADVGTQNLSRVVLVREALESAGAGDMPIWFTHFGWTGSAQAEISPEEQAQYVESGMRRARSEWAWAGLIFNWALTESQVRDRPPMALLNSGQPTLLLGAMAEFGRSSLGQSITSGFVPPDSPACEYSGNWQDQFLTGLPYRTVRDPDAFVTCKFFGTGISTVFRFSPDSGTAEYVVDGGSVGGEDTVRGSVLLTFRLDDAFEAPVELASGLREGEHTVTIGLQGAGELVVGGFVVRREQPMIWPIAVLVSAGLVALFLGMRSLAYLAAEHVGLVEPRSDSPDRTPLPVMPDWRPDPRSRR